MLRPGQLELEFLDRVIGLPYERSGLHCWALVRQAQSELFGRELPAVLQAPENKRELIGLMAARHDFPDWLEVAVPQHGAVVFMSRKGHGPSRAACHSGIFLDLEGGGVLHTDDPHGVVFETPAELRARNWSDLSFFVPA